MTAGPERSRPLLADLGAYVHGLSWAVVPEPVRDQAALTVLDTLGCMLAGSATADGRAVIAAERAAGATGTSPIVGHDIRMPLADAARINGYLGDIHELNDLTSGHTGIGIVPAALAVADASGSSGAELLLAVVAGVEAASRVYNAFYSTMKPYDEVGMVSPGVVNAVGAAAASARLLGLDEEQTIDAMACAVAHAGWCPADAVFGAGNTVKPYLFGGVPAAAGIRGALLARHGITGPRAVLESPMGYFRSVARSADADVVRDTRVWHLAAARRKLHANCGYTHSAVDTAVALRAAGMDPSTIARIRVEVPAYVIPAIAKATPPADSTEARFHLGYATALAFTGTEVIAPVHSERFPDFAADREVARLMAITEVVADDAFTHYHRSRVSVTDHAGHVTSVENDAPRGSAANPLSELQLRAKFGDLALGAGWTGDVDLFADRVLGLASADDSSWIVPSLSPAGSLSPSHA